MREIRHLSAKIVGFYIVTSKEFSIDIQDIDK